MHSTKFDRTKFKPLRERRGIADKGERPLLYYLFQKLDDCCYWEARPLYDQESIYYSGGPMEYVEVIKDYVKDRYPDLECD